MQIKKYNPIRETELKANEIKFFVQSVGDNSGRPLREPIPNSWEVITDRPADFQILYIIFESKILKTFLRGSVIPFLALAEYKNIIAPILKNAIHENEIINKHYLQIEKIEAQILNQGKIKILLQEMKKAVSAEVYKKYKAVI